LEGAEYNLSRKLANAANNKIRKENNLRGQDVDVHEIKPVKFNGSPTNTNNKLIIDRSIHRQQIKNGVIKNGVRSLIVHKIPELTILND